MAIGNKIRKLRIEKNIAQEKVADQLGVDRRTYAAWETEEQDIKSKYIPELANFFGVEISDLFKQEKSLSINQTFNDSKGINTAILILTDKESINKVLDALKDVNF